MTDQELWELFGIEPGVKLGTSATSATVTAATPATPATPDTPATPATPATDEWDDLFSFEPTAIEPSPPRTPAIEVLPPPRLSSRPVDDTLTATPPNDAEIYGYVDDESEEGDSSPTYFRGVLVGQAGSGKTTLLKTRIAENPRYGVLAATTGIAAVNLSTSDCVVRTINSVLGFYDEESLKVNYQRGKLVGKLMDLVNNKHANKLIVDEMSMMSDTVFEIIDQALKEVNMYKGVQEKGGIGLMLVGDFLQLPPVKGRFVFESDKFVPYAENIEKLTKIWRQTDPAFMEALQAARVGDGERMVEILYNHPEVKFANQLDDNFDGTTIVGTNEQVDRINFIRLQQLRQSGKTSFIVKSSRWGKEDSSWKNVPGAVELCDDAYVMILNNGGDGAYANGSCGWVTSFTPPNVVTVKLHEPKTETVAAEISLITRRTLDKHTEDKYGALPEEKMTWTEFKADVGAKAQHGLGKAGYQSYCNHLTNKYRKEKAKPYYDFDEEMWVVGEITYLPVRLAYATTVHKSQGLTLDRCQIDYVGSGKGKHFFGGAGMSYVAMSRVRTPQGLRIVGSPRDVEKKTNVAMKVLPWA